MCNLSEGVLRKGLARGRAGGMAEGRAEGRAEGMAKGRAEGMAEGILTSIQSLMKNIHVSAAQAMVILDVPDGERQKYLDLLEKQ